MTTTRKTATIERYQVYGTPRYELRVTYRGRTLRWRGEGMSDVWAIVQNDPIWTHHRGQRISSDVYTCRVHAERMGFTHVRIAGDWDKRTKPAGGKL